MPDNDSVVVVLKGGLGNQLLQLACGLTVARRTDARLVLDPAWFGTQQVRQFELEPVAGGLRKVSVEAGAATQFPDELTFREAGYRYDDTVAKLTAPVALHGYFPLPRYVQPALAELRRVLLAPAVRGDWLQQMRRALPRTAVAVHVRRGDYVENERTAAHHGGCSLDYYSAAWRLVARVSPDAVPVLFSDDVAWLRDNLLLAGADRVIVEPPQGEPALQSVLLMSAATHWIIANSTFSWWGATLGREPGRITVAPRPWWANPKSVDRDLLWPDWLTIDARPDWGSWTVGEPAERRGLLAQLGRRLSR